MESRRLIVLQVVIAVLAAVGFYFGKGAWEALSAFFGGLISVMSAVLLRYGVVRAGSAVQPGDKKKSEALLYAGAAIRFLLVLACFAIGLAVLKLAPLAMVSGFVAVQLVFLYAAHTARQ